MNLRLIGIGAAGNKASIEAIEQGVLDKSRVKLLNSTMQDIPADYMEIAECFAGTDSTGGCGKEPEIAEDLMMDALRDGRIRIDNFFDQNDQMCVIVTSTEGASGNGGTITLARYISEVLGIHVSIFAFVGFKDDARGINNTVRFFNNLSPDYTIQAISNLAFFTGSKTKAEKLANEDFAKKLRVLCFKDLVSSKQNIDETDQLKLSTTPGFMVIEQASLERLKSKDAFNEICENMINNSSSLEFEGKAIRIGVIINGSEKTLGNIDDSFKVIKDKFGDGYEFYHHIQSEKKPETVSVIAAGLKLPKEEVLKLVDEYNSKVKDIDTEDSFFADLSVRSKGMQNTVNRRFSLGSTKKKVKSVSKEEKMAFLRKSMTGIMEERKPQIYNVEKEKKYEEKDEKKSNFFNTQKKAEDNDEPAIKKY